MSQEQSQQFIDQATQSLHSGQFDQALDLIEQAISLTPKNSECFILKGIALSQSSQPQAAVEAFRTAISLSPYNAKAYFNLAVHYYSQGQKVDALDMAREATHIDAKHAGARELKTRLEGELNKTGGTDEERQKADDSTLFVKEPEPEPKPQDMSPGGVSPMQPGQSPMMPPPGGPGHPPQMPVPGAPPGGMPPSQQRPQQGTVYTGQPPYGPPPSSHGVQLVENMGSSWVTVGWLIFVFAILGTALRLVGFVGMLGAQSDVASASGGALNIIGNIMGVLGYVAGLIWMLIDLIDRKGNYFWMLGNCCCSLLILPIYLLVGRND